MCFFTSLSANAAAVAKRYGKQLDIIEAARQVLAEQEQEERARQEADPGHKVSVYDIRLAEDIYVSPLTPSRNVSLFPGATNFRSCNEGLIPRMAKPEDAERYKPGKPVQKRKGRNPF